MWICIKWSIWSSEHMLIISIDSCSFSNNSAATFDGAISLRLVYPADSSLDENVYVTSSNSDSNYASSGGAIYIENVPLNVEDSNFG